MMVMWGFVSSDVGLTYSFCRCWSLLYSAILRSSWADSLSSHVILHEWIASYSFFNSATDSSITGDQRTPPPPPPPPSPLEKNTDDDRYRSTPASTALTTTTPTSTLHEGLLQTSARGDGSQRLHRPEIDVGGLGRGAARHLHPGVLGEGRHGRLTAVVVHGPAQPLGLGRGQVALAAVHLVQGDALPLLVHVLQHQLPPQGLVHRAGHAARLARREKSLRGGGDGTGGGGGGGGSAAVVASVGSVLAASSSGLAAGLAPVVGLPPLFGRALLDVEVGHARHHAVHGTGRGGGHQGGGGGGDRRARCRGGAVLSAARRLAGGRGPGWGGQDLGCQGDGALRVQVRQLGHLAHRGCLPVCQQKWIDIN